MSMFGSRDDRRRRLAEESAGDSIEPVAAGTGASKAVGKTLRYANPARRENHRPVSDLIPRRGLAFGIWYFVGLLLVAGLLAGSVLSESTTSNASSFSPLFDLVRGSSLMGWFSSVLFAITSAGCVLVYSIRRHKVDDYKGRYRVWLWAAAAWMLMSIDATANIHSPFAQGMALATGWTLNGEIAVWWIGVWGTLLGILGLRLVFETRECRTAMSAYLVVAVAWVVALGLELELVSVGPQANLVVAGCRLVGQLTLLFATCIYARHVLLDAEGLIEIRVPKPKRDKKKKHKKVEAKSEEEAESDVPEKKVRVDAAHKAPPKQSDLQTTTYASSNSIPANRSTSRNNNDDDSDEQERSQSRRGNQSRYEDDDSDDEDSGSGERRKMSKAERKKLRRSRRMADEDE